MAPFLGLPLSGKQFGWGHTPKFCWPQARKNACWGVPQTRCTSGQIVPKSRRYAPIVCGMSLLLLGLIFPPVRYAEQMINVRLDCHSLPHIRLGLAVIRRGFYFDFFCTFFLGPLLRSRFAYDIIHPKTRRDGAFLPKRRFVLWSIWVFL